jgi:pyruvate formate lyase activating enzyme
MAECVICHKKSDLISRAVGLCAACIQGDTPAARDQAAAAHGRSRQQFRLPAQPPRAEQGVRCDRCVNVCKIDAGQVGYCGVRHNEKGRVTGGDGESAAVSWYHDPLPTNCVADWVCPASTVAGYPTYTDTQGPEYGYKNLAVFYEACSFDCLFCQNFHYKYHSDWVALVAGNQCLPTEHGLQASRATLRSASDLVGAVDSKTRCICYFGGDPSCQIEHALAASRLAREKCKGRILRICWESNGSMSRSYLKEAAELSLESGGCIKFDLKAWDDSLHRALCGVSNRRTLENFEYLGGWISRRPEPPFLIAATLLVPGYIDAEQVGRLAKFIARLDPNIPYALLAFHPDFEMRDLPTTSRRQALECLNAAHAAGLTRVRIGNMHLLA